MTKNEFTARQKFTEIIVRESKTENAEHLAELILRHGVTYSRLQEDNCNGVGSLPNEDAKKFAVRQERFEARLEKKEKQIEARITAICDALGGFIPVFGGDPRGHTIVIRVPSGYESFTGSEGVSVPTS